MKLVKVTKKDATERDLLIEKLAKGWGGVWDARARLKASKNPDYRKYIPEIEKIGNRLEAIMNEIQGNIWAGRP